MLRCGGQVVRRESAKLIFAGSIPARTLRFEPCVERQRRVVFCQKIVFKNTFSLLSLLFVPAKSKQKTRRPTRYKKQSGTDILITRPTGLKQITIFSRSSCFLSAT